MRSAGTCGKYERNNALVTCGHGNTTVGSSVLFNGNTIGTVVKVQYANNQFGDYSIIKLDNIDPSHKIGSSNNGYIAISGGTYLSPAVGTYVTKYGFQTGYSYGSVISTNVSITTDSGITVKGMTKVLLSQGGGSIPGDSGGPYLVGDAFCGVHHGHNTSNNNFLYFTPYSVISAGGFTATSMHSCLMWLDVGSTYHSGYCSICKETVYMAHSDHWDSSQGKCTLCGRTDSITLP